MTTPAPDPPPMIGPVCTPEVEGVDCPIYCCALQELPIQEVTSESSGAVTDNDYIENEVPIDNNLTAPGEDSSNIIHADVLMVEPPDGFGIARVKSEVARSTKRPRKDDHTASPTLTGDKVPHEHGRPKAIDVAAFAAESANSSEEDGEDGGGGGAGKKSEA